MDTISSRFIRQVALALRLAWISSRYTSGLMTDHGGGSGGGSIIHRWWVRKSHTHGAGESGRHLDKITFVATACRTDSSDRFIVESSKPLKSVFQVTPVTTSRTPHKHTLYRLVTNKAHTDTTSTILTNFPGGAGGAKTIGGGIGRWVDRFAASWTRFMDANNTKMYNKKQKHRYD